MDYTLFCFSWRVETVLHLTWKVVVDSHCNPSRGAGAVLHLTLSVSADNLYNPPRSTANSLFLSPEDARRTLTPAKRSHPCWPQSIVTVEGRLQCNMTETEQDLFTRISSSEVSVNTLCTEYQPLAIANHNSNPSLASRDECGSSRRRAGKVEENCGESCLTALYRTMLTSPVLILPKLDAGFNSCSSSSDLKMDGERKLTEIWQSQETLSNTQLQDEGVPSSDFVRRQERAATFCAGPSALNINYEQRTTRAVGRVICVQLCYGVKMPWWQVELRGHRVFVGDGGDCQAFSNKRRHQLPALHGTLFIPQALQ